VAQGIDQAAREQLTRSFALAEQFPNSIEAPEREVERRASISPVLHMAGHTPELSPQAAGSVGEEEPGPDLLKQRQGLAARGGQAGQSMRIIQNVDWRLPTIPLSTYARYVIGGDIDRSHLTLALADLKEKTIEVESSHLFDMDDGPDICLKRVVDDLQTLLASRGVAWEQVIGIGLATPGPLDDSLRKILSVSQNAAQKTRPISQMPGWEGLDIPDALEHKLKLKKKVPIYLGKDTNMGALGESRYGHERGTPILVYVKVEMGIGAGIVIGDQLYCGTGAAGELGHVIVVKERGKICACGNRGCLETVAATPAIVKASMRTALHVPYGPAPGAFVLAKPGEKRKIAEVIQAARHGDAASQIALKRAGTYIGIAIGGVINFFSPSMILLDGEVVHSDFLFDALMHTAKESSLHVSWRAARIKLRTFDWPVVVGAIDNAIHRISNSSP
jgi:predicted NBD/HSP70 family sugar kinase